MSSIAAASVLFGLACLTYGNAGHDRLFFDSLQLTQDPVLTDWGRSWNRFLHSGVSPGQDLALLTFAANHAWNVRHGRSGFDVTDFLLVNVLLHAANTVLVFLLLRGIQKRSGVSVAGSRLTAFLCAAVFAVHPLHATSVAYIVQRRGLLAAFFYLAAILAYLRVRQVRTPTARFAGVAFIAIMQSLSMKSKTMGMTLPIALIVLEGCLRAHDSAALLRLIRRGIPIVAVCGVLIVIALGFGGWFNLRRLQFVGVGPSGRWGAWSQFWTQMTVLVSCWRLILLPLPGWLSIDHPFTEPARALTVASALGAVIHAGLIGIAYVAAKRRCILFAFGLLIFYVSMMPWLFVPQGEQLVEYKSYLGCVGAALMLAEAVRATRRFAVIWIQSSLMVGIIALLFFTTRQRNALFKDPILLWQDVIAKYPDHFRAHVSLGTCYADAGKFSEALDAYGRADRIRPGDPFVHYYMGNALQSAGRLLDAVAEYQAAAHIAGGLHITVNLSNVLSLLSRTDEAMDTLRSGLAAYGGSADSMTLATAHFNLANGLAGQGHWTEAEEEYRKAVIVNPSYANAYFGLGVALNQLEREDEAEDALKAALRIKPDLAQARQVLQGVLEKKSQAGH